MSPQSEYLLDICFIPCWLSPQNFRAKHGPDMVPKSRHSIDMLLRPYIRALVGLEVKLGQTWAKILQNVLTWPGNSMFFWSLWYKLHEAIWYIFVRWCSLEWRLHIFHLEPFRIQPHHHQLRVRDTYKKNYFRVFKKEGIWKPVFKLVFNQCSTTNRPRKECQMPFWLFY